jgi:RNA recognition motif-containing protein
MASGVGALWGQPQRRSGHDVACVKDTRMSTNIYVGNLPYSTTVDEIRELFSAYGTVEAVNLITDRDTGRLRGFGFVEMANTQEGAEAIAGLHGTELHGRTLVVNAARPRTERRDAGGPREPRRRW